jgi:hypothetical protein
MWFSVKTMKTFAHILAQADNLGRCEVEPSIVEMNEYNTNAIGVYHCEQTQCRISTDNFAIQCPIRNLIL